MLAVSAVTASRMLPRSSFQEHYHIYFKNVTAVTASRLRSPLKTVTRLPQLQIQECYRRHLFKKATTVTVSVTAARMLPLSSFQKYYRCFRFKKVTAVTVPRMLPLLPFLHLSTPSLLVGVHSNTLFGVSCRDNFGVAVTNHNGISSFKTLWCFFCLPAALLWQFSSLLLFAAKKTYSAEEHHLHAQTTTNIVDNPFRSIHRRTSISCQQSTTNVTNPSRSNHRKTSIACAINKERW